MNGKQLMRETAVVERSNSSCIRPWMRKVVGSNLDEDLYRNFVFLLWIDWTETVTRSRSNWNDNNCDGSSIEKKETVSRSRLKLETTSNAMKQEVVRINLLRLDWKN